MSDSERRHKLFFSRVELQMREIQHINREIISFSKQLSKCSNDISDSQVNTRKMQFIKTEIKDKLREFANNIDQVCKILDRKTILIMKEIVKEQTNSTTKSTAKINPVNSNPKINRFQQDINVERTFSDTLNPQITRLQAKIVEYQNKEIALNKKIEALSGKNQKLLEEFNRLSNASNKKINQLNTELIHRTSFSSDNDYYGINPGKNINKNIPSPSKPKKSNKVFFESDQQSYSQSYDPSFSGQIVKKQEKTRGLSFGCMPKNSSIGKGVLNFSGQSQQCQKLDKNDRNRRFDLLLNKLRDSQQNSTEMSSYQQPKTVILSQENSVFSQKVIKRYQI